MDVGLILKESSLEIDKEKLAQRLKDCINTWNKRSLDEIKFLKENSVGFVISDIVPWILKSTSKSSISSFTWVDIYKEYFNCEICDVYEKCYELADKLFLYPLYIDGMKSYLKNFQEVGLFCRSFDENNIKKIKEEHKKKKVFVGVDRSVELRNNINVENLNYDFIVTEGIKLQGNNVTYLTKEVINTQDYIKASDYIITKADCGIISEILCANKKCAVLSRNSIDKLKTLNLAVEINYEEDFNIKKILEQLVELKANNKEYKFKNQYKDIANK